MSTASDEAAASCAESLTETDRVLLLAIRAWAGHCRTIDAERSGLAHGDDFTLSYGPRLEPGWARRLSATVGGRRQEPGAGEPAQALARLREMHRASARVELAGVHPSWLIRALQDESPAVKRIVVASFPESARHRLQAELLLDSEDIKSERPADLACREWALGLWTERLVGGERAHIADPPAVIAMTRLSPRAGYGLCRTAGFAKMVLAEQSVAPAPGSAPRRARREWVRGRLEAGEAEFRAQVIRDVQSVTATKVPPRFHAARLGLLTFSRLLADFEPFRLRWALQHWPYPIAKLIRALLPGTATVSGALRRAESLVLQTAWDRLALEGRITIAWPDSHDEKTGAD
jgi:hypothetical protein